MVALNNASFQESAYMFWTELRAKRLMTNQATQGEECELPLAEQEESEMLTRRTPKFKKLFQRVKEGGTSWATVP